MKYEEAIKIANDKLEQLRPHCERIQIAGSLLRKCKTVGDIEIVAIPKPYETGMFASGIVKVCDQWKCVKGNFHNEKSKKTRYTQRILPEGIKLDLFLCDPVNWGYILAIRTGSAEFSKKLSQTWKRKGFYGKDGYLHRSVTDKLIPVHEEIDLFKLIGIEYVKPEDR